MKYNSILLGALLLVGTSYAGDLKAPFAFPSARVLPEGIRNFSMKGLFATASQKYNGIGETVVLADALNSEITFQKVYDAKKTDFEKCRNFKCNASTREINGRLFWVFYR